MSQNCNTRKCSCEDAGLHTQCPICNPVDCPEPSPCAETFDSKCIIYNGAGSECAEITTGLNMEQVTDQLLNLIEPFVCLTCATIGYPTAGLIDVSLTPTLSWSAVPAATGYDVYFGTSSTPPLVVTNTVNTFYIIPAPLVAGTVYYWKIVPRNVGGSAADCITYSFTTLVEECTNPFIILLESLGIDPEMADGTLTEHMADWGRVGSLIMNNCDLCCPDCETYVLGSLTSSITVINCIAPQTSCCLNVAVANAPLLDLATLTALIETYGLECCNDFNTCIQTISSGVDNFDALVNQGIIEFSTLNDNTALCVIYNTLVQMGFSAHQIGIILLGFIQAGVVIKCLNGILQIYSIDVYIAMFCQPQ
jgi:hypothetical protein